MLRRFLYLNDKVLDGYLSAAEGGLADQVVRRQSSERTKGGHLGVGAYGVDAQASVGRDRVEAEIQRIRETPEQRFDRLMQILDSDPDRYSYEEALDLTDTFPRLAVGSIVSVDCEIEVPAPVRLLAQPEEVAQMLDLMDVMRSIAPMLGEDAEGLPTGQQSAAIRSFTKALKSDLIVVGEQCESGPKVVGKLQSDYVREIPDGDARVVGKVRRIWRQGEKHALMALPGASLLSREQRRKAELDFDDSAIEGPAVTLDILAIFL